MITGMENRGVSYRPALLKSESPEEFTLLLNELVEGLQPRHVIQRMYVNDVAVLTWEIMRYRRVKTAIINNDIRKGIENVLRPALFGSGNMLAADKAVRSIAHMSFLTAGAKRRVSRLMEEAELDPWAAEAEAVRLNIDNIEKLDRLIAAAELRRDKALALYEERFTDQLRWRSDLLLDRDADVTAVSPGVVPS